MMLTVSMTVSHLYQNLRIVKGVRSLNRLLKVLIIAINAQSHCVDATLPPWLGGRDHLCPYGRKLIGSLVPVYNGSVRFDFIYLPVPRLKFRL